MLRGEWGTSGPTLKRSPECAGHTVGDQGGGREGGREGGLPRRGGGGGCWIARGGGRVPPRAGTLKQEGWNERLAWSAAARKEPEREVEEDEVVEKGTEKRETRMEAGPRLWMLVWSPVLLRTPSSFISEPTPFSGRVRALSSRGFLCSRRFFYFNVASPLHPPPWEASHLRISLSLLSSSLLSPLLDLFTLRVSVSPLRSATLRTSFVSTSSPRSFVLARMMARRFRGRYPCDLTSRNVRNTIAISSATPNGEINIAHLRDAAAAAVAAATSERPLIARCTQSRVEAHKRSPHTRLGVSVIRYKVCKTRCKRRPLRNYRTEGEV